MSTVVPLNPAPSPDRTLIRPATKDKPHLNGLRSTIEKLERRQSVKQPVLRFGIEAIDSHLPWGGLPRGQMHQVLAPGKRAQGKLALAPAFGFVAALAGLLRRDRPGLVFLCQDHPSRHRPVLFEPGLRAFGLNADNMVFVRARTRQDLLWAMEDCLNSGAPTAVIGELDRLSPVAARRLQLAAEQGGVTGFLLGFEGDSAGILPAATRWRISALPRPAAETGYDRNASWKSPLWQLDLLRSRGASPKSWSIAWDSPQSPAARFSSFVSLPSSIMEPSDVPFSDNDDTASPKPIAETALALERTPGAFRLVAADDRQHRPGTSPTAEQHQPGVYPQASGLSA